MLSCKDNLRIVFIIYLLTLLTGCDSSPEVSTAKQKEENAISEVSAARAKAFNNGDALGIAIQFFIVIPNIVGCFPCSVRLFLHNIDVFGS